MLSFSVCFFTGTKQDVEEILRCQYWQVLIGCVELASRALTSPYKATEYHLKRVWKTRKHRKHT